jgi:predicted GH43/DUF377 family glycosyl hydrolase
MFEWTKLGQVFDPTTRRSVSWMQEFAQAPSALLFERFVRVYFSCRAAADERGQYVSRLAYIDLDRSNLLDVVNVSPTPIASLGDRGTFDEFGMYPASVIRSGDEIRLYYAGWTRCESVPFNAAIGVVVSRDGGETFARIGAGPVLSYSPDEPFVLGSPKIRKYGSVWYLWYASGRAWRRTDSRPEPVYQIRMARSDDGIQWTREGRSIVEQRLGGDECQAAADVYLSGGTYHMFFSHRHYLSRNYRLGYASSLDLANWTRDDARVGIDVSDEGWDSESISYAHVFDVDGRVYMLYQGNQIGRYGFGLARLEGRLS